ncbi:MAG: hypothetical protein U1E62_08110 [Alsobacter sp.]
MAVREKVGAISLPSWTKRTSPAASCAEVKLVAAPQVAPTRVSKEPCVTPETV